MSCRGWGVKRNVSRVESSEHWLFWAGANMVPGRFPSSFVDDQGNRWALSADVAPFAMLGGSAGAWYGLLVDGGVSMPTVGQGEGCGVDFSGYYGTDSQRRYTLLEETDTRPAFYSSSGSSVTLEQSDSGTGTAFTLAVDTPAAWNLGVVVHDSDGYVLTPIPTTLSWVWSQGHAPGGTWPGPGGFTLGTSTFGVTRRHQFFWTEATSTSTTLRYRYSTSSDADYEMYQFSWPDST